MDNVMIFSKMRAGPVREVAEFLHDIEADDPLAVPKVIDAAIRLAVEVDRITPRVIDHDDGPTTDNASVFLAGGPDSDMTPAHRLRLLLTGLDEMQDMIHYGQAHGAHQDTLTAVAVRLSALREAHRAALDNPSV